MGNKKNVEKNTKPDDSNPNSASGFLKYTGMATQMLGTILVFTYGGYRLDAWQQNKTPVWTLVLSLTSIAASLYLLIRGLSKTYKND